MKKLSNILYAVAAIPAVLVLFQSIYHLLFGYQYYNFQGDTVYGIEAFIKTIELYVFCFSPFILLQLILIVVATLIRRKAHKSGV